MQKEMRMQIQTEESFVSRLVDKVVGGTRLNRFDFVVTVIVIIIGVVGAVGVTWGHAAPRRAPQSKVEEGKTLFADNCARCHVDGDAPSLDGVFKGKVLPSGAAATDENVRAKILHGGDIMPGYEDKLTSAQIDALIAYLHTL
jgi:mono/diheme cytochrome c family protein